MWSCPPSGGPLLRGSRVPGRARGHVEGGGHVAEPLAHRSPGERPIRRLSDHRGNMAGGASSAPRVVRLSLRAFVLGPIRAALSSFGLLGSLAVGGGPAGALLGWALGAGLIVMFLAADPRHRPIGRAEPLPPDATRESWSEIARTDIFPSTVTLAVATGGRPPLRLGARRVPGGDPRRDGAHVGGLPCDGGRAGAPAWRHAVRRTGRPAPVRGPEAAPLTTVPRPHAVRGLWSR